MANNSNPKQWTLWHTVSLLVIVAAIFIVPLQVLPTITNQFSMGAEFEGDLNNGSISKELTNESRNNSCLISKSAEVTKNDGEWRITEGDRSYIVEKEDGKLKFYESFPTHRQHAWVLVVVLMMLSIIIAGHGATGEWTGLLIDERNRMSLSRLQMILWTVIVLSGLLVVALSNITLGAKDPLAIALPKELWMLMGISTASLVGSPLIRSNKKAQMPETEETKKTTEKVEGGEGEVSNISQVVVNEKPKDARFSKCLPKNKVAKLADGTLHP
ncbi:MAG: hypothetical protein EF813_04630 [Methanosarcinales archaeon]|nr:MAG: hypothetical protein EF813_04630 [Methanosarcinales archaeon]